MLSTQGHKFILRIGDREILELQRTSYLVPDRINDRTSNNTCRLSLSSSNMPMSCFNVSRDPVTAKKAYLTSAAWRTRSTCVGENQT